MKAPYPHMVADIGGTNARFGWIDHAGADIAHVRTLSCDSYEGVAQAFEAYLEEAELSKPAALAMGVATAVTEDFVQLTNRPSWSFSTRELQGKLALEKLVVLNDFTALALALPSITAEQLVQIGGGKPVPHQPIGLIGPGTGLGVSGLMPTKDGWLPISGEGGHATMAAANQREAAVLDIFKQRFGHASAERALCGNGLVWLYEALAQLDGIAPQSLTPADVRTRGIAGDPACKEVIEMFCAMLGTLAGNLALTLGARGGIYIGGGIAPRLATVVDWSVFRERFEHKGRRKDYLAAIPVFIICAPISPALFGAARALDM